MSFAEQTSAFFDELSKIERKKRKLREEEFGKENRSRPFSNLLTQEEEPSDYSPRYIEDEDPEVYVRAR